MGISRFLSKRCGLGCAAILGVLAAVPQSGRTASTAPMDAVDDYAAVEPGGRVRIYVLRNDWIPAPRKEARVSIVEAPKRGRVEVGRWGRLVYRANPGAAGEDRIVYRVEHASGESDTAEVTVFIRRMQPLDAVPDLVSVRPGKRVRIHVLGNDRVPSEKVQIRVVDGPLRGTVTIRRFGKQPMFQYRAARSAEGQDRFVYEVTDDSGRRASATVTIQLAALLGAPAGDSAPEKPAPNTPSGDPGGGSTPGTSPEPPPADPQPKPTLSARPDQARVVAGTTKILDVLENDTVSGRIWLRIIERPSVGSARVLSRGRISFRAPSGYKGQTRFVYQLWNRRGQRATATVNVEIACPTCAVEPTVRLSWQPPASHVDAYEIYFDRKPQTQRLLRTVSVIAGEVDADAPVVQFRARKDLGVSVGDRVCFRVRSVAGGVRSALSEPTCEVI